MKFVSAAALALIGCLVGFNSANAQGAAMKTTPTTKILAIGTINPGFEQSQVFAVLPEEVRETVDLYLDGKIEQWYSLQGKPGVAFIINVTDPAVAHEMLEKLPLGKAHMMSFELIPIGPLNPLRFLQGRNLEICRALLGRHARALGVQSHCMMAIVHIDDAVAATVAALTAEPGVYNIVDDDPLPVAEWLPAFARWVNAPEPPRLSVDNALKIAGEEAVHFHTSLSGVARAKAKLGFNPRPLLWKDSRTSTAAGS